MLEVRGLSVEAQSQSGPMHILRDVDLTLPRASVIGIVGESGSGKSTLVRAIGGFLDKNCRITSGSITIDGQPLRTDGRGKPPGSARLGLVLQSPMASLNPTLKVRTQMKEVLRAGGARTTRAVQQGRMRTVLEEVGFSDYKAVLGRYPHQLSGGMAQRAAIGMAMLCQPPVVIGDECTTALDASLQARVVGLFRKIADENQAGVLLVTHDLALAGEVCDQLIVVRYGQVIESGPLTAVLSAPRHKYTRALINAVPSPTEKRPIVAPSEWDSGGAGSDCVAPAQCGSDTVSGAGADWLIEPDGHGHRCSANRGREQQSHE